MGSNTRVLEEERANASKGIGGGRVEAMSVEEFFNSEMETIAVRLREEGMEFDQDGNLVKVDTPYAMGADVDGEKEEIIVG